MPDLTGVPEPVMERIELRRREVVENPNDGATWGRLGMAFHAHGLFREARQCYEMAAARASETFRWPYYLGRLHAENGQHVDALDPYELALRLNSAYAPLCVNVARSYVHAGRLDVAKRHLARSIELSPMLSHAHLGLGEIALREGHVKEAAGHLQRAATFAPEHGAVHVLLATAHRRLGNVKAAQHHAEQARELPAVTPLPDPLYAEIADEAANAVALVRRGDGLSDARRYAEAIDAYREALRIRPDDPAVLFNLAGALARADQATAAIDAYRRALRAKPDYADAHNNLGNQLSRRGAFPEAIQHYRAALRITPDDARTHCNLGFALAVQGNAAEAITHFEAALRIDPSYAPARAGLSRAHGSKPSAAP